MCNGNEKTPATVTRRNTNNYEQTDEEVRKELGYKNLPPQNILHYYIITGQLVR